jgi:hypothetical protein
MSSENCIRQLLTPSTHISHSNKEQPTSSPPPPNQQQRKGQWSLWTRCYTLHVGYNDYVQTIHNLLAPPPKFQQGPPQDKCRLPNEQSFQFTAQSKAFEIIPVSLPPHCPKPHTLHIHPHVCVYSSTTIPLEGERSSTTCKEKATARSKIQDQDKHTHTHDQKSSPPSLLHSHTHTLHTETQFTCPCKVKHTC